MAAMDFHLNKRFKAHPFFSMGWGIFQKGPCCFNGLIYRKEAYTEVMGHGGMSKI